MNDKVCSIQELSARVDTFKKKNERVVYCHGVFDLLHLGHMRHLQSARRLGDRLVVTVTADKFVKRGPGRPVFNQFQRAEALSHLGIVDLVGIVEESTAIPAIIAIKPSVYVKGPDYAKREKDATQMIGKEESAVNSVGGVIAFTDDDTMSSSELINLYVDDMPAQTREFLQTMSKKYSIAQIQDFFEKARSLSILVIGDTIIDQYNFCTPIGRSAKESIVVHKFLSEEDFAGGVLATGNHLAQLCDNVSLVSVLGRENPYDSFITSKLDPKIKPQFLYRDDAPTTLKRRYINPDDRRKHFEVIYLNDSPLPEGVEEDVMRQISESLSSFDLVVVNDFGHGMLTQKLRALIVAESKMLALNAQANSANFGFNLVTRYPSADFVCVDELEIRLATREKHAPLNDLIKKLYYSMGSQHIVVTRGSFGSVSYSPKGGFVTTPALASSGLDKVGAGDAFFAFVSACMAAGMPQDLLSFVGNAVGALKLQIIGNREPVKKVDLIKFLTRLLKF